MKPGAITDTTLLVIGYGNTLRSDDAAGPLVAGQIGALGLPGVRALACAQLAPELAAEMADAVAVVFVDAAAGHLNNVVLEPITPDASGAAGTHAFDPHALLAMALEFYGNAPAGWLLRIPAEHFDHGENLSASTRHGIVAAVRAIQTLVAEWTF